MSGSTESDFLAGLRTLRHRLHAEPETGLDLRADVDALPVTEQADVPYRSAVPETMHACGHDLHTSMPVGAARLLSAERARLAGSVAFMFRPGEEGFDGAGRMIDDGVLEVTGDQPAAAYALHVMSAMRPHGAHRHQARPAHGGCRRHLRHGAGRGGHRPGSSTRCSARAAGSSPPTR